MEEEWKVCIEHYDVSNIGNVRRKLLCGNYKDVNGSIMNRGYKYFQIKRNGKRINYLVHQEVARLFIGERPTDLVIDHIDRNKLNNNVCNLRYITQKENTFNNDRVKSHIPQDTPNRQALLQKEYQLLNKEKIALRKKEKIECEKCKHPICRAYMTSHLRLCDGTYARSRSGWKIR
jgi:hypothetical protein